MDILVLGGTQMLGRDFVETILSTQEHSITLANRGLTNPNLFPSCRHISIDRNHVELCTKLENINPSIVIDFSCYNITQFNNTIAYLKNANKYILISTISVLDKDLFDKNNPYVNYALGKKELEQYVRTLSNMPPTIIARPCAIYGDHDYTQRFEKIDGEFYWKYNKIKADKNSGCLSVRELSDKLLSIINGPITSNLEIINITT